MDILKILAAHGIEVPQDKQEGLSKSFSEELEKITHKLEVERDGYKDSLETAQTALKEFEGVDVKDLQGKVTQLTADLAAKDTEYQAKIADMEFNSVLDSAISASGARNAKAVKALLEIDALKSSKNQAEDIKKAIETVKTDNDFLFGADEPINNAVRDTGNGNAGKKMSLAEAMAYKNAHPETDVNTLI